MPLNLSNVICGGAKDLGGSYLANPIYTAILITVIIFIILVWHYWGYCGIWHHITAMIYIFAGVAITLICHNEIIHSHYNEKYRNKAADELTEALINKREQELMGTLTGRTQIAPPTAITPQVTPQQTSQLPAA